MPNFTAGGPVVGMVGGGQLARMTHQAAIDLGIDLVVLARSERDAAVRAGSRAIFGEPDDPSALAELASRCDVVTFDHEHVPVDLAMQLARAGHLVYPAGTALKVAQDKLHARDTFHSAGFHVPAYRALEGDISAQIERFAATHGWPVVLKLRTGGYDGRGVAVVPSLKHIDAATTDMGPGDLMVEAHVEIAQELAIVGIRTPSGQWAAYPPVGTLQVDGICNEAVMPAPVSPSVASTATDLAKELAEHVAAVGIFVVELFLTTTGDLVINEVALRPHNSGHATIEAAMTSQFHNHLRAILDWPLGDTSLLVPAAAMVNVLGGAAGDPREHMVAALAVKGASLHLYGKDAAPGRKLGHVTAVGPTVEQALEVARRAAMALSGGTS